MDFALGPGQEIVIAGDPDEETTRKMVAAVHTAFLPNRVLMFRGREDDAGKLAALAPYTENLRPGDRQPTVYLCQDRACRSPITDLEELQRTLDSSKYSSTE